MAAVRRPREVDRVRRLAPSLAGSPRVNGHRDYVIKAVLHGLTGPLDGKTFPQVMVAMGSNRIQWIADVASYVRTSFRNNGSLATMEDVARVRAATADRKTPWTIPELEASLPRLLVPAAVMEGNRQPRRGIQHRRPTPKSGYNYVVSAAGALTFLGGRPACRNRRACGSRSNCRNR